MSELISVIVPAYNVEKYLNGCIESLINQSYSNIEIILVDDGSTDMTGKICDMIAKKDKRILSLHKKNGGLSDARNYGLKYANGDYITFVDSDDLVAPEMIEILYESISVNNADVSIIDPTHFFDNDTPKYRISGNIEIYDSENSICTMLYQKKFLVSAWGKLYRKSLFINNKFPVGMIFEDIAVMYKIFSDCNKIVYNNSRLYGYRHRDDSITTKKFSKRDLDILKICDEMNEYFKNSSTKINKAVNCYTINANFRVYLNSVNNKEFENIRKNCKDYILKNSFKNLMNIKVRFKLKMAILLFIFARPFILKIYSRVDRWN